TGTFIHNGSGYSTINQLRLMPGIYSRKKRSGLLETLFNVKRGTGRSFAVNLDPQDGIFRFRMGTGHAKLYSALHYMGVSDAAMRDAWGDQIFEKNQKAHDPRDLEKLLNYMV